MTCKFYVVFNVFGLIERGDRKESEEVELFDFVEHLSNCGLLKFDFF